MVHRANMIAHDPDWLSLWLQEKQPDYLATTPAMALRLAEIAVADPARRIPLREILTYGEVVTPELRLRAREAFGARVSDRYSCEEVGWIAAQCPHADHLHVLTLSTIVEIVDNEGGPCAPGQPGRVLLTDLHGYAMPLLRYEIGDLAEWGEPHGCGIHLPVLSRIWGRSRSFVRRPDGSLRLARLTGDHWRRHAPIREYRVVQYADGLIEAFVVPERPLSPSEDTALKAMLVEVFDHPFNIIITETSRIDWTSRWKREDVTVVDWLRQAG
jgi:phenylacetate-CoA ligase